MNTSFFTAENNNISDFRYKCYLCIDNKKIWNRMAKYNVKKANHLVELEEKMSKSAQLWVSYLVASLPKAQSDMDDFPTLVFTFKEMKAMINADGRKRVGKIDDVHKMNRELVATPLWYESEERAGYVAWLTDAYLDKKSSDNQFVFRFHPGLKPYLLNLKEHYTRYNYFYRICLTKNSMKIYEILKRHQYKKTAIILKINEDIKYPLGLLEKYEKYYDFRRKVLDVCQTELEKFTDIRFTYTVHKKEWNKVISLSILIEDNVPTHLPEPLLEMVTRDRRLNQALPTVNNSENANLFEQYPEVFKQLMKWGGGKKVISGMIVKHGIDKIKYQLIHTSRKEKEGSNINDYFGWFRKAVDNEYKDAKQETKKVKAQKAKVIREVKQKKESWEKIHNELKAKKFQIEKEHADSLIDSNTELLNKVVEDLKISSIVIRKKNHEGKTIEEMYAMPSTKGIIINKIKEYYPEGFAKIDKAYKTKLESLKTKK